MGEDPEQLRAEIARTRAELGQDLDTLVEKVTPAKVVERKVDATKEAVAGVKDKIMGTAGSAKDSVMGSTGAAGSSVSGALGSAGAATADVAAGAVDTVSSAASHAPAVAKQKAAGNPLAAGVVAFGIGWLVSSLLPASQTEQKGASKLKDAAAGSVKEQVTQAAAEIKDNLAPAASEAVAAVKDTATDAAAAVKDQAGESTAVVKDQAASSAGSVADTAKSAAQDAKDTVQSPLGADAAPTTAFPMTEPAFTAGDQELTPFPADPRTPYSESTGYADRPTGTRPPL